MNGQIVVLVYILLYERTAILQGPRFCNQHMYSVGSMYSGFGLPAGAAKFDRSVGVAPVDLALGWS